MWPQYWMLIWNVYVVFNGLIRFIYGSSVTVHRIYNPKNFAFDAAKQGKNIGTGLVFFLSGILTLIVLRSGGFFSVWGW